MKRNIGIWVIACRFFLAGIFLFGGIPKLFDIDGFAQVIGAYGLLPDQLVYPFAVVLPLMEVVTAIGLIMGRPWSLVSTLLLYALFIFVLSYGILLGLDIDCGCFSTGEPEHKAFSGLRTALYRDIVFLIPLFFLFWVSKKGFLKTVKEMESKK